MGSCTASVKAYFDNVINMSNGWATITDVAKGKARGITAQDEAATEKATSDGLAKLTIADVSRDCSAGIADRVAAMTTPLINYGFAKGDLRSGLQPPAIPPMTSLVVARVAALNPASRSAEGDLAAILPPIKKP